MIHPAPSQSDYDVWVGIDAGKRVHHATAVDLVGNVIWSKTVSNDQAAITELVNSVHGTRACWALDLTSNAVNLLLALLAGADQDLLYVPGRTVNRMSDAFGEGKTDAKDSQVIAHTARMRRDLHAVTATPHLVAELQMLTSHRADEMADWVRGISRLRELLSGIFPALERAFDYSTRSALVLAQQYQTPAQIRAAGRTRMTARLRRNGAWPPVIETMVDQALVVAKQQTVELPAQGIAAELIAQLASRLLETDRRIKALDKRIAERFRAHPQAGVIESLPGMGPQLGAEFIIAVGDLSTFRDSNHLASYAGLAPVPRDSGRVSGNLHRPKHYNRSLRRVFYMSALSSLKSDGPNRAYYDRKRAEHRKHNQALLALARRRVDVLWALLRDDRHFSFEPPGTRTAAA